MKSEQSDTASVRYENTELLHHAFGSVGGSSKKAEPDFDIQSRLHRTSFWSESHAPADSWCSV